MTPRNQLGSMTEQSKLGLFVPFPAFEASLRQVSEHFSPHSPDNALSFGAACAIQNSDQHLMLDRARRPWRTQGVNRDRMLFGWISTAA